MEAVIDPAGPTIVGQVPPGACRHGGAWEDFVTVPIPDGLKDKPLKVALVDGAYVLSFDVDTMIAEAWVQLRAERNRRLAASDWVGMVDANLPQDQKDAWFAYRQKLRDLPGLVTDPTGAVPWPVYSLGP
jgi:hypothetical protein